MSPEELRKAGFNDAEISSHLKGAGFSEPEITEWMGAPISTITGKPVPTVEEHFKQARSGYASALPIAGDIAATALMPQLSLPAKGASIAARLAPRAANLGLRMLGSGAGSAAGTIAEQKVLGEDINLEEAGQQGMLGAAGEAGIAAIGGPLKFAGGKIAKPAMEFMSDITLMGSAVKSKMRKDLIERTTKRASDFIKDISPDIIKKQNIPDIDIMVEAALDENRVMYSLYKDALDTAAKTGKEQGRVLVDDFSQTLGDIRGDIAEKLYYKRGKIPTDNMIDSELFQSLGVDLKQRVELKQLMGKDTASSDQIQYLFATIFKRGKSGFESFTPTQQQLREKLKTALKQDLDKISLAEGKTVGDLKTSADETFKAVKQYQFVKGLFDKSMLEAPGTGARTLQPKKLHDLIYEKEARIKKEMPDLWDRLKAEADFYKDVSPDFAKEANQLVTGPGQVFSRGVGMGVGSYLFGPAVGVPLAESTGAISAYALMSPKGRKIISGIINQTAKAGTKAGIHLGGENILMKSHE
jgi:hypothetical protein